MENDNKKPVIVGLVCERAVDLSGAVDSSGKLIEMENVNVILYPCSGMIKPSTVKSVLDNGAHGAFVCGCAMGDCHYRVGNIVLKDRLTGDRPPKLKKAAQYADRIGMLWLTLSEKKEFMNGIKELNDSVSHLVGVDLTVATKPKKSTTTKPAGTEPIEIKEE